MGTGSEPLISNDARFLARTILTHADTHELRLATAESCTGGMLASLLTDITGLSHCFECGFVVYSDEAKMRLLGVSRATIQQHGAVSREAACEMVRGALDRSNAKVALSITGFAGPALPDDEEGLVHLAVASTGRQIEHQEHHFGPLGRDQVRQETIIAALKLLARYLDA